MLPTVAHGARRTLVFDGPASASPLGMSRGSGSASRGGRGAPLPRLEASEVTLLRLLSTEAPMDAIARTLDVSERTLRRRSRALFDKLGVGGRIEAAVWATRRGLL